MLGADSSPQSGGDISGTLQALADTSMAGVSRRLGPTYEDYHPGGQAAADLPEIFLVPPKPIPAENGGTGFRYYQIGGPWTKEAGDFSSTQGQVVYVPDQALGVDPATHHVNEGVGVDRVTIIEMAHNCFTEKPEPPWWGGFRPDPTAQQWWQGRGLKLGQPIAVARGLANWSNCGLVLFSSGLIASAGTVTGHGLDITTSLPPGKQPTAIAITNKSEFALVTVTDVATQRGQVAVFALASGGRKSRMPHEWADDYPGLANIAVFSGIKLLGYVDLPGMAVPTGISAVGNRTNGRVNSRDGNAGMLSEFDLNNQADRDNFNSGNNAGYVSTTGFAVVVSKSENKAAFLDLQALFAGMRRAYLTTPENFAATKAQGEGAKQWPPTFDADPSGQPVVVKVVEIPRPTAVLASMWGGADARAVIASEDGALAFFSLGGLATEAPAKADEIMVVHRIQAGRNPTWLAYQKYGDGFLVVSRGDREIAWVNNWGNQSSIVRRLHDRRLLDPVYAEVSDTHGIEGPIVTVVDFKGRKILNYRYGKLRFTTQGGAEFGVGDKGRDEFECGGWLEFPGYPFAVSATNVN